MRILKQISADQSLKIALRHLSLQESKGVQRLQVKEYGIIPVKPAVKGLKSVHEARRIVSEICLPVTELKVIDARPQGLFIQPLIRQLP